MHLDAGRPQRVGSGVAEFVRAGEDAAVAAASRGRFDVLRDPASSSSADANENARTTPSTPGSLEVTRGSFSPERKTFLAMSMLASATTSAGQR